MAQGRIRRKATHFDSYQLQRDGRACGLDGTTIWVCDVIYRMRYWDEKVLITTVSEIAHEACLSRRTVANALPKLHQAGLVDIEVPFAPHRYTRSGVFGREVSEAAWRPTLGLSPDPTSFVVVGRQFAVEAVLDRILGYPPVSVHGALRSSFDFARDVGGVRRMESPESSMRFARSSIRSNTASAIVASPSASCQFATGS